MQTPTQFFVPADFHFADSPAARIAHARASYPYFVATYFPHLAGAPCATFQLAGAAAVRASPQYQGLWQWFRGAAKSTHAGVFLPLWLAIQDPPELHYLLLVGKSLGMAVRQLRELKQEIETNTLLCSDFGFGKSSRWAAHYFHIQGGPVCTALGMGQSPRGLRANGHRPDYILADDLDYPALSANPSRVQAMANWLLEDLLGTQDLGRARFLLAGNRFSSCSLQATLEATGRFQLSRVNALTETGAATWPEKYGDGNWFRQRKELLGYRAFQREYMNEPVESGGLFRESWIRYEEALPWPEYTLLLAYIDPSFSNTPNSDYKACKLWGAYRRPSDGLWAFHHLRAFLRQCGPTELVSWCYDLYHEGQARGVSINFHLESNLQQHQLLQPVFDAESQYRGLHLPIHRDLRSKPPKYARLEVMSALWERGLVAYDATQASIADTQTSIAQLLALAPGNTNTHDDGPDADEGALFLLQQRLQSLTAGAPLVVRRKLRYS